MAWPGGGLGRQEPFAFAADALVAVQLGSGPGARLRVGRLRRGGEHEGQVRVGAAGHRRVQPLPVLVTGDQRDSGVHGAALGGVPGDRIGQVRGLVAGVAERPAGEPPLSGRRVGLEQAADHQAAAGDGLDPQDVPVGQGPARLARLEAVVVAAADDQVPGRRLSALRDAHGPGGIDHAEVHQVIAYPGGQFPAPGPVRGHQQDIPPGQVAGHVGMDGLIHRLLGRGAADPAVPVIVVQRGGVPAAQPQ